MKRPLLFGLGLLAGTAGALATGKKVRADRERMELARRLSREPAEHGKNIVILGSGFAGINAAHRLLQRLPAESGWKITLVDRRNYFLFTPLLYHAATGLVDPTHILFPSRALSQAPHYHFREASVEGIDLQRQAVRLDDGELEYDVLLIGLGSVTNFFGQEAKFRQALTLKTMGDGVHIRNRIIDAFERADIAEDPEERRHCLTFAVVGGGATGVELIGAIRGLIHGTLPRQYPRIRPEEVRLVLFESSPEILPGLPAALAEDAVHRMKELGIEVRLETRVATVDESGVTTVAGEHIPARTVVWAAGVRPSPLVDDLDVPKIKNGRINVDSFLQVQGFPNVYAAGDIAAALDPDTDKPLPPSAAVAVQEGKAVADIIADRLAGKEPRPFAYQHRGELVSLGRHEAVAEVFDFRLTGFPAWVVWRAFYLSQLMGFKNQLGVALDWTFAYAYQRDTVRLDVPATPLPQDAERRLEPSINVPRDAHPAESAPESRDWATAPLAGTSTEG